MKTYFKINKTYNKINNYVAIDRLSQKQVLNMKKRNKSNEKLIDTYVHQ